ncbi:MAG: nucleotide exchange factor GrpE [Candidatus Xiphinematobacter sp.]|nr:MAG: nucleotide exchange factor GrpE [Candidatus Xiphinematobacter sp.]
MTTPESVENEMEKQEEITQETTKDQDLRTKDKDLGIPAPAEGAGMPPGEELEAEIIKLKMEAEGFKDLALRCQAELENYRKRVLRERDEAIRYGNTDLLGRLLPVVDSFELGLEAAKNASDTAGILVGMNMVWGKLQDFLRENGVQAIDVKNAPFDPKLHEAVSHEHSHQIKDGYIIRQLRCGYKLGDRLLRPSTVVTSKGAADS